MAFSTAQANILLKLPLQSHMAISMYKTKIMRLKMNLVLYKINKSRLAEGSHCT